MIRNVRGVAILVSVALGMLFGAAAACGSGGPGGGQACETDDDCPGDRVCSDGACNAPWKATSDAAAGDATDDEGGAGDANEGGGNGSDVLGRDGGGSSDGITHTDIDRDDGGGDGGGDRPLSCFEFSRCAGYLCDRYDYECRGEFASRMPQTEKDAHEEFSRCNRNECSGTRGQERSRCIFGNCAEEWRRCYERPTGPDELTCSEFKGCVDACSVADDPMACRQDCQARATSEAPETLRAYTNCYSQNCQGKSGTDAIDCLIDNCEPEFRACFGC